jgi:arylsulfatase
VNAAQGSPNVLIILTDDTGFGMVSTFGGPSPTPTLDRLAKNGLRYNCFHTTALCSPTRAALLAP